MFSNNKLSIHIRDNMIKFVEGKLINDSELKINKFGYLDVKSIFFEEERLKNNYNGGRLLNSEDNVAIIKKFIKKHNFSTKKVYLTIGNDKIITRVIQLPRLPLGDIDNLIKMESNKHFPVDLSKYTIDYRILNVFNEDDKIYYKILVCAIPRKIIREYTELMMNAGLKPTIIDINSNAISRLYRKLEFEDVAILDTSVNKAELLILDRGIFYIHTTFPFEIKNYIDLYRNPDNFDISTLDNQIKELSKNIKNYINFYLSKNEGKNLDTLYVTGDIALIKGITEKLDQQLDIDVIKGFDNLIKIKNLKRKKDFNEDFYCGNLGTLLRGE